VMVHLEHASAACAAMVCSVRLEGVTFLAVPWFAA